MHRKRSELPSGTSRTSRSRRMNQHSPGDLSSRHLDRFNHDDDATGYDLDVVDETQPIRAGYADLLRWTVERAAVSPDHDVLELGSGTGNLTCELPVCRQLVCVDISRSMTEIAMAKLARSPGPAAELATPPDFVLGDVLEFCRCAESGSYDRIVSTYTLHHLEEEEKWALLEETLRILRPGGALVVGDLMFEDAIAREEILEHYRNTDRIALADEIQEEFFWDLSSATEHLSDLGFTLELRRFSQLSWGFCARLW